MRLITIVQARAYCKSDAADDDTLTLCVETAESVAAQLANRDLFPDAATLNAAIAAVPAAMDAARTAYSDAEDAADALDDSDAATFALDMAQTAFDTATIAAQRTLHGIVADHDVIGAVLQLTAHFYTNRQSVTVGVGAAAVEVPFHARAIMEMRRWAGRL